MGGVIRVAQRQEDTWQRTFSMERETHYLNTDLEIRSRTPVVHLCEEFTGHCWVLYQTLGDDGNWYVTIETNHIENSSAESDIKTMLAVVPKLSHIARRQWDGCHFRNFNMGFDCGDTWGYPHLLSVDCIRAVAEAGCSISITLYPIREEGDGDETTA